MKDNNIEGRNAEWRENLRRSMTAKERMKIPRVKMPELKPEYRIKCNDEVNMGITAEMAVLEAKRCLDCPNPQCVTGCPVSINIPQFIKNIERGNFAEAAATLKETSALPAVCGRVCPQEKQCESKCIHHKMNSEPVAIGYLERFAADYERNSGSSSLPVVADANGIKIAVVGSGPAALSFSGDMAKLGYEVTVYEALHEIGGVLKYGIPEFRLPNTIVDHEINGLKAIGVKFETDIIIGKTLTYDDLHNMGYKGIFVASGAGLPRFMNIPGENLNGVMSSNEYLTRINLMGAGKPDWDTPVLTGKNVAVIGGGNTAMDSVRTARRMGADRAILVYRRSEEEMPARIEGEPDASGRRSPIPIEGAIEEIPVDLVIVSVGVSPNPLVPKSIEGLEISNRNTIMVDNNTMRSSIGDIYAGGDIVRGGATVILAMGDGRRAAANMHEALKNMH